VVWRAARLDGIHIVPHSLRLVLKRHVRKILNGVEGTRLVRIEGREQRIDAPSAESRAGSSQYRMQA
jgi:hypothetical protein